MGFWLLFLVAFWLSASAVHLGANGMILGSCFVLFWLGFRRLYLRLGSKELLFCKTFGFVVRPRWNDTVVVEQRIYNLYIRLEKIIDQNRIWNFCLTLGGCHLEPIRLTRMGLEHGQLRTLGRLYARTMNLNYFDFDDVSPAHRVRHFRNTSPWEQLEPVDVNRILKEVRVQRGDRLTRHLRMWLYSPESMIQRITERKARQDAEEADKSRLKPAKTDLKEILWDEYVEELQTRFEIIPEEMKKEGGH